MPKTAINFAKKLGLGFVEPWVFPWVFEKNADIFKFAFHISFHILLDQHFSV